MLLHYGFRDLEGHERRVEMLAGPILVPLDGSELSAKAIPYAVAIARATNQSMVLLTVWEGVERELRSTPVPTAGAIDEHARVLRQDFLDATAHRVLAQEIEVRKELREGRPSEELLWYCDRHQPGLLIMATHGRSGIQRMWYGSVATRLMQMAPVPTLLVGPTALEDTKATPAIRSILVPLGGSPLGEVALEPAAALAEALGARLILARATRLPAQTFAFGVSPVYVPDIEQTLTSAAEEYLLGARDRITTSPPPETRVLRGSPAAAILEFVAREGIDLVVMASHARTGVARWTLGSVADRVIQGAAPVLLIRPEAVATLTRSEAVRARHCHNCGRAAAYGEVGRDDRCLRCGQHLHACSNCVYFDNLACMMRRPESHETYPGLSCPRFQFLETVQTGDRAKADTES
jgi:nucleotide-binding universal stress UspA family protein